MREGRKNVEYKAARSKFDNCLCNGCHGSGYVYKITYPETLFFDGNKLTTKYNEWWLCDDCIKKLAQAVHDAKIED